MAASREATPPTASPSSARLQLARAVLGAALAVDGVVSALDGPLGLHATRSGTERLQGVVSAADAEGGYAVTLYLLVRLQPLQPLAARIRAQVATQVAAAGLAAELAQLDIVFEDVALDGPTR